MRQGKEGEDWRERDRKRKGKEEEEEEELGGGRREEEERELNRIPDEGLGGICWNHNGAVNKQRGRRGDRGTDET